MASNQNTYEKRKREVEKKAKAAAKRRERAQRRGKTIAAGSESGGTVQH